MIVLSGILTLIAVGLLIAGVATSHLPMLIGAVVASGAAGGFLVAAIRQRRAVVPSPAESPLADASLEMPFPPMAPAPPTTQQPGSFGV